ncbi:hypothetical protein V6N13_048272 [Hibiscus sabdariffa]
MSFCRASLEVSKKLGLSFDADKVTILNRFLGLRKRLIVKTKLQQGPRPFKWFNYLADDKDYVELIKNECSKCSGDGIGVVLRNCKMMSNDWVANKLSNSGNKI